MKIAELLELRGLDIKKSNTKLVRHPAQVAYKVDGKIFKLDLEKIYGESPKHIETYQSYQERIFDDCEYVISFIGGEGVRAKFVGSYRVNGWKQITEMPVPLDFLQQSGLLNEHDFGIKEDRHVFYNLERIGHTFDDLTDRIVIDWGRSTRKWHQWLSKGGILKNDKEVLEILPKGYRKDFKGYDEINITFDELVHIINNPAANREWHRSLEAVAGVYLIIDNKTGNQYVGSASGEEGGILGRWKDYVRSGHGGNTKLKELILSRREDYPKNFRFSILHILSKTSAKNEVIKWEEKFKAKLGTRAFGLN